MPPSQPQSSNVFVREVQNRELERRKRCVSRIYSSTGLKEQKKSAWKKLAYRFFRRVIEVAFSLATGKARREVICNIVGRANRLERLLTTRTALVTFEVDESGRISNRSGRCRGLELDRRRCYLDLVTRLTAHLLSVFVGDVGELGRITAEEHRREEDGVTDKLNGNDHQQKHFGSGFEFGHEYATGQNAHTFHDNASSTGQERGGGCWHAVLGLDVTWLVNPVAGETDGAETAANRVENQNRVPNQTTENGQRIWEKERWFVQFCFTSWL